MSSASYCNYWNCGPILSNILILALSLYTLEFLSDSSTANIEILTLSFQTLEFWPIIYTHWFSDGLLQNVRILPRVFRNIGILILSFSPLKYWNSCPLFINNENVILSFPTLEFGPLLMHIGFLICPFKTLGFWLYLYRYFLIIIWCLQALVFWPYFRKRGFLTLSLSTCIGVLALLEFLLHPSKRWNSHHCNSGSFLSNIGIVILFFHSKY